SPFKIGGDKERDVCLSLQAVCQEGRFVNITLKKYEAPELVVAHEMLEAAIFVARRAVIVAVRPRHDHLADAFFEGKPFQSGFDPFPLRRFIAGAGRPPGASCDEEPAEKN